MRIGWLAGQFLWSHVLARLTRLYLIRAIRDFRLVSTHLFECEILGLVSFDADRWTLPFDKGDAQIWVNKNRASGRCSVNLRDKLYDLAHSLFRKVLIGGDYECAIRRWWHMCVAVHLRNQSMWFNLSQTALIQYQLDYSVRRTIHSKVQFSVQYGFCMQLGSRYIMQDAPCRIEM